MNCTTESAKSSLSRGHFDKSAIYSGAWKQKFDFGLHFALKYKQEDLQLPLRYCIVEFFGHFYSACCCITLLSYSPTTAAFLCRGDYMLRFRVDGTLFVLPQLTRSGSNPLRSTTILLLCMGYSPETTSSVIPGSQCNVFRFFHIAKSNGLLSQVFMLH